MTPSMGSTGRSCVTNLLRFHSKVCTVADNDTSYDIVYLDFSKAFNEVPHDRLSNKIRAHGIDEKFLI